MDVRVNERVIGRRVSERTNERKKVSQRRTNTNNFPRANFKIAWNYENLPSFRANREYQPNVLCRMYAHLVACTFICIYFGLRFVHRRMVEFFYPTCNAQDEANSASAIERIWAMKSKWKLICMYVWRVHNINVYTCQTSTQHTHLHASTRAHAHPFVHWIVKTA